MAKMWADKVIEGAEIERLYQEGYRRRAENIDEVIEAVQKLLKQNDRYRHALEEIVTVRDDWAADIARAALAEDDSTDG